VAQGAEFLVNSYTTAAQGFPGAVVAASASGFIVAWGGYGEDGSDYDVLGRRFDASGLPRGAEFRVNSYTTGSQSWSSVASDLVGNFVVVWNGQDQDGSQYGVFGQRFDASGARLGGEFRVNSHTTDNQLYPQVTVSANGAFVVVWTHRNEDGGTIFGQRYDASGMPQGGEFHVSSYSTSYEFVPSIAAGANGEFVVVWTRYGPGPSRSDVLGQRYDASGVAVGGEFQVNTYTTHYQYSLGLGVASAANGRFIVTWQSDFQDGSGDGVFAQRFAPDLIFADGFD
jgi:hypothetical protein